MSLLLSSSTTHGSPIVVTTNSHSAEYLNDNIPSDTVFSTQYQFLIGHTFSCTDFVFVNNNYFSSAVSCKLPVECVNFINNRTTSTTVPLVLYAINNKILYSYGRIYNNDSYIWTFANTGSFTSGTEVPYSTYPSSVYCYKFLSAGEVGVTQMPTSIHAIVTNINVPKNVTSGGIEYNNLDLPYSGSGITITKNSFVVKGTDILHVPYVTRKNINSSSVFFSPNTNESLSVVTPSVDEITNLSMTNSYVCLNNAQNQTIFDTRLGYLHIAHLYNNFSYTDLGYNSSTNAHRYYINNIIVDSACSIMVSRTVYSDTYNRYNSPFGFSLFYHHNSTLLTWYYLTVSASGTTYKYSISVENISGILRYVFTRQLVYMGGDGNPGAPLNVPPLLGIVVLHE